MLPAECSLLWRVDRVVLVSGSASDELLPDVDKVGRTDRGLDGSIDVETGGAREAVLDPVGDGESSVKSIVIDFLLLAEVFVPRGSSSSSSIGSV